MKERAQRLDKKHRFLLRIDEALHCEIDAKSFRHNISLNLYYCEAVAWAFHHPDFQRHMELTHTRDMRRGHFTYYSDYREKMR